MANTKETLNRIVQIANNEEAAVARFNDNVDITNRAIADSLSRTGKGNNAMEASLDMNGNAIINTVMRPVEKRLDGDVVVWGEVKNVLTYTNLIGQNLDKIALVGNNINKVIAVADRIDRVSYLADNLWALSDFVTNNATSPNLAIGNNSSAYMGSIALGFGAMASGPTLTSYTKGMDIAIGYNAKTQTSGTDRLQSDNVAIGSLAMTDGTKGAVAIGFSATAEADNAIQLGQGTNSAEGTFQFRNYPLVDANGKIPAERLPDDITGLPEVLANEQNKIEAIEGKIPANASTSNKLSTSSDLLNATQDVRADFAEADTELQMQINGQAAVLTEVKEDAMSNMAEIADLKQSKQDKLVAGANITIQGNVISATGGGGGGEVVVNSDSYRSLDAAQKAEVLVDGTYEGSEVADGEVFTQYDGKFVEFDKEFREAGYSATYDSDMTLATLNGLRNFAEGNGVIVGVYNGKAAVTSNGITWEVYSSDGAPLHQNSLIFDGTQFVTYLSGSVYKSTDGRNWSKYTVSSGPDHTGLKYFSYDDGRYVIFAKNKTIWTSPDAVTWTQTGTLPSSLNSTYNITRASNGTYCVLDKNGYFASSTNLTDWSEPTLSNLTISSARGNPGSLVEKDGILVTSQYNGSSTLRIFWSEDGVTWTACSPASQSYLTGLYKVGSKIFASGEKVSSMVYSEDGKTFTAVDSTLPSKYLTAIAYGLGKTCVFYASATSSPTDVQLTVIAEEPYYEYSLTNLSYTKDEADTALTEGLTGVLKNLSTANRSLSIAGTASTTTYSTNVGYGSTAKSNGTSLGHGARADGVGAIAIGTGDTSKYTKATGFFSVAIGPSGSGNGATEATASYAIQLGSGTNSVANTMNVGLSNTLNVQLLDANGNIPAERLVNAPVPDVSLPITNCITEIPQDIKLELVNGTLTLKNGSVIHVPNGLVSGAASFTSVTLPSDRSVKFTTAPTANTQMMVFCSTTGALNANIIHPVNVCTSGTTAPSATPYVFWNTTSNRILYNGNTQVSLPIAIITQGSDGVTKSIDKVFNGFGYIGSTVFALPGVKGLIPNGRNSDGSLNNTAFENTAVCTAQIPADGDYYLRATADYINFFPYNAYYDSDNNFIRKADGTNQSQMFAGSCTIRSGAVAAFNPKEVFRSTDGNELRTVVSTFRNGDNWYRVWSDGWIEQGGVHAEGAAVTITFLKAFTTTNYTPLLTAYFTPGQAANAPAVTARATTSMTVYSAGSGTRAGTWYACGY